MQGLPQSRAELRVAPGRPYADERLQNHGPAHRSQAMQPMPAPPIPLAPASGAPAAQARHHDALPASYALPQPAGAPSHGAHAFGSAQQPDSGSPVSPSALHSARGPAEPLPARAKRPDSAFPGSPWASSRPPVLSMPRAPSEPRGLRVDVPEASAPLRVARSRPSPTQAPPVPAAAREQIAAAAARTEPLHTRSSSSASDVLSLYDHYDDVATLASGRGLAQSPTTPVHAQSPTLPRSGPAQPGFLSRSVSAAKPAPAPAGPAAALDSAELSIEQFEAARKHAASQPHDPRAQLELAKKLWQAANSLASHYVDPLHPSTMEVDERVQARNRDAWTSQAIKIAKPLAAKTRNPDAMFFLGSVYSTGGHGVEKDYVKALEYYQRAAQLDHTDSCYRIAVCEEFGVGTRRDFEKALSWYHKAAVLGSVASMYKLGMLSLLGSVDHKRDFRAGMAWLQSAADHADAHNPHALHELGLLYEHSPLSTYQTSDPLPRNDAKALEKFYVAAKLGYAPSQTRLGRAFEFGELGCSVDPNWSISWYTQAAKQRDSDAELALAGWYWTGSPACLKKSETEAFLWAERAAGHGNARALFTVGYFYECGIGVPKDAARARRWYSKAAEKKHPRATERLRAMVEASS